LKGRGYKPRRSTRKLPGQTETTNMLPANSPSALIFDMDGVLIDSEPLHKRAKEETFRRFGIVVPESVYDSYKGRSDAIVMQEILAEKGASAEMIASALRLKHEIFEASEHELQPVPGAIDFLKWAKPRYRLALATSATPRNRAAMLEMLGVAGFFETIVDAGQFQRPKPDPEVFLIALHKLELTPAECWVIEDTVNGVQAAKSAGCAAVAITTTFDRAVLSNAGADLVVDSFAELRALLEEPTQF
jgi:beta-phosphoglucomutase